MLIIMMRDRYLLYTRKQHRKQRQGDSEKTPDLLLISRLIGKTVADHRFYPVVVGAEAPKLYLLGILDIFGITVAPFDRYFRVCICVDKNVECAVAVQHGKECNRGSDLSEDSLDLLLDLLFCFLGFRGLRVGISENKDSQQVHRFDVFDRIYPGVSFSLSPDLRVD